MNICVFCSAQNIPEEYTKAADEFATLLGKRGHTLIWGGSDRGTMKTIADAVTNAGGKVVGISMELLKHKIRKNADEIVIARDLSERKRLMLDRSDAFVALAGGIGTLDEVTEALAIKRHGGMDKPVVFLNTRGFYQGIKMQFERMNEEGFLKNSDNDVVEGMPAYFADTPEDAIHYTETYAKN